MAGATYHYHRAPICANAGNTAAQPTPYADTAGAHSPQLAWANDGFGIYGFQDAGGSGAACSVTCVGAACTDNCNATLSEKCHCGNGYWTGDNYCKSTGMSGRCERAPVTDACNGHFGPVPGQSGLSYHYHSRVAAPYTIGCYGPSWGQCASKSFASACKAECPAANTVGGVCVATGFTAQFDIAAVAFGSGYGSASCTMTMPWYIILAIVLGALLVVGVAGFFGYRWYKARQADQVAGLNADVSTSSSSALPIDNANKANGGDEVALELAQTTPLKADESETHHE